MENKLDNYFREQLSKREYPFQEAYWEAAQALLQRKKRRRRIFFWLFFGMAAVATGWWMWPAHTVVSPKGVVETSLVQQKATGTKTAVPKSEDQPKSAALKSTGDRREKLSAREEQSPVQPLDFPVPQTQQVTSENEPALTPVTETELAEVAAIGKEQPVESELTSQRIGDFSALPLLTAEPLPLPWEKRFVRTEWPQKLPWFFQNWSVLVSQVFTGEQSATLNRIGYRMALRKDMKLKSGFYLFAGTGYEYRSGTFEASKVAVGRNYRFGLELDSQFLKPNSLHFVDLPIGIGVSKTRHQFELSLSPRFLLGLKGERGFYQRIENTHPPQKQFVPVDSGWLVEDGFKKLSLAGEVAYWFRFNQRTAIGASAHFQPGGVLEKNYSAPIGNYILKESGEWTFRLSARLGF